MEELTGPFSRELVRLVRAHDAYGQWDGKPDAALLAPFIIDKEKARAMALIANPDAAVLARVSQFYGAVALLIEKQSGIMAAPVLQISSEGFGRAVLICGALVAVSKTLRDVHRFGFASAEKLESAGMTLAEQGLARIERFKDAATAD